MIVTLAEVKAHLRILTSDEDALITSFILQAQTAASEYCGTDWTEEDEVPETVRLAIFLFVAHLYENRDFADKEAYGTMMTAFKILLYPNRKPEVLFG